MARRSRVPSSSAAVIAMTRRKESLSEGFHSCSSTCFLLQALKRRVEHTPFAGSVEVKQGLADGWEYGSCFCSLDFLPSYGTHAATHPQQRLRWCGKTAVQAVKCRQEQ